MTDIIPVSDLLPCPFCGGPASLWTPEQRRELKLGCAREPACDQCGASLGFFASHAEAVKGWNTRPLSTDKERLIEALGERPDLNCPGYEGRLRKAYCVQQTQVPDQSAIVWRSDLLQLFHELYRRRGLASLQDHQS